jgi:hypothetical protein
VRLNSLLLANLSSEFSSQSPLFRMNIKSCLGLYLCSRLLSEIRYPEARRLNPYQFCHWETNYRSTCWWRIHGSYRCSFSISALLTFLALANPRSLGYVTPYVPRCLRLINSILLQSSTDVFFQSPVMAVIMST